MQNGAKFNKNMIFYCFEINQRDYLNCNGTHKILHFNAWYPVTMTVWK